MLAGGAVLVVVSGISGELNEFSLSGVTFQSIGSLAYLIVFGSLIAYSSYIWLLKVSTPSLVSTYAYVNPVIALLLGLLLAGEELNARIIIASIITVAAVALIIGGRARSGGPKAGSSH